MRYAIFLAVVMLAAGAGAVADARVGASRSTLQVGGDRFVDEADPGAPSPAAPRKKPRRPTGVSIPWPPPVLPGTSEERCTAEVVPFLMAQNGEPFAFSTKPCCAFFDRVGQPLAFKCEAGSKCVRKNGFYGACLPPDRMETNINENGWEGTVLECGDVMSKGCPDLNCRGVISDPAALEEAQQQMREAPDAPILTDRGGGPAA